MALNLNIMCEAEIRDDFCLKFMIVVFVSTM